MPKFLLCIATKKGFEVLQAISRYDNKLIGLVTTFDEKNVLESYSEKIKNYCMQNKINYIDWVDLKPKIQFYIQYYNITEALAVGFRYLIPLDINKYLKHGLIVFHDSILPRFRGFAPTPTAILCGEKEIGMSVIFASENVDGGPIILQKKHSIGEDVYISEAINIQCMLYTEAVIELIKMILEDNVISIPQNESEATYSIWRNPEDCMIDWRDSSSNIYNLIRAVSYPYPGAYTFYNGQKIIIWKARRLDDIPFEVRNPGKLWEIDLYGNPAVVCGQGMLKLENVTDINGNKIIFKNLRVKLG